MSVASYTQYIENIKCQEKDSPTALLLYFKANEG